MALDRSHRPSRVGLALIATGVAVMLSGCGSGPVAAPAGTLSAPGSASASALPAQTLSGSSAPVPTAPTFFDTQASAQPGGTSVQMAAPCDGGSITVKAYPAGSGVGMTATLHNTRDTSWTYATGITPERAAEESPKLTRGVVRGGNLVIHATNLRGAAPGLSRSWPQSAGLLLYAGAHVDCDSRVYLDARKAQVTTPDLQINVLRSGVVAVEDGTPPAGGRWRVTATVQSPAGIQQRSRSVKARKYDYPTGQPYHFNTKLTGLTGLRDFTSLTVTASRDGKHRTWATITRTP